MSILLQLRNDAFRSSGGDLMAAMNLESHLAKEGVVARIETTIRCDYTGVKGVQVYNTTRAHEPVIFIRQAARLGVPSILVPTWHSARDMKRFYSHMLHVRPFPIHLYLGLKEWMYGVRGGVYEGLLGAVRHKKNAREAVIKASHLVVNSHAELANIELDLAVSSRAVTIIPNAIVTTRGYAVARDEERRDVLCVGRVEPRKNQVGIIKAFRKLKRSDHKLVFVGALNHLHRSYCEEFIDLVQRDGAEYVGPKTQEEVFSMMGRARLLVSASFFETTALVGLEALNHGANVAITDADCIREYYGDEVVYLDPYCIDSIAEAIELGIDQRGTDKSTFVERYSWAKVIESFVKLYEKLGIV